MAAKKKAAAAKPKRDKEKPKTPEAPPAPGPAQTRKETRENPGKDHNIADLAKLGADFVDRYLLLNAGMESDKAGYMTDIGKVYTEASNALGIKESVIQREFKRILKNKKDAEKEAEMKTDERQQTVLFRTFMGSTQYELFTAGELAPAAGETADEEKTEEEEAEDQGGE